jgi:type VI secretion system secreted protein VgrG
MSDINLQSESRGSEADYVLGTPEGWDAFDVVRWHAVEAISQPFQYAITLLRLASRGDVALDGLVDAGATFRIATEGRWRTVHGIIAEAEEIDRTAKIILYRVLLVPHLWRSRHRRRCRTFVGKPLAEIVATALESRAPGKSTGTRGLTELHKEPSPPDASAKWDSFKEPSGEYRWAVSDRKRIDEPRAHVVQYNESDFDFMARLLEEEGLSYFFEHTEGSVVMTITDRPGRTALFERDETFRMRNVIKGGASRDQEVIRTLRAASRLRSRGVKMRDFAWRKSLTPLEASVVSDPDLAEDLSYYEYPARDEDEPKEPGALPARVRMERFEVERSLTDGSGTVRTMEPGFRFKLKDDDGLREDAEYLLVGVETYASQLAPEETALDQEPFGFGGARQLASPTLFENRFQVLPAELAFRPARATPKPRIFGVTTARVTAEEIDSKTELNSDEFGRVRVRFPWDQRPKDGTATSKWIRVAQYWAGAAYGSLYVPRVGHEVLVAFEQGDPDRPIVVGRVYNEQNKPPYTKPNSTVSTLKSDTVLADNSGSTDGFNEFRFEDEAGKEEIFLHAQKDLNEVVLDSHSTSVGGDQSNSVGGNQSNSVEGDRTHTIKGTETVTVTGDRTTHFKSNESHTVSSFRKTEIGANDDLHVKGWRNTTVDTGENRTVHGQDKVKVDATRYVTVGADHLVKTTGFYKSDAGANHEFKSTNTYFYPSGDFQVVSTSAGFTQSASFTVNAAGCSLSMSAGVVSLSNGAGSSISLLGGLIVISAGGTMLVSTGGPLLQLAGGPMAIIAGGDIAAAAPTIHLNG